MKKLILTIRGIDTIRNCVKVDNNTIYVDSIIKNQVYNNVSTKSIKVTNICGKEFLLPAKTLFSQQDNFGSTFKASINEITIPANSEVNVPVYYSGIYKNTVNNPRYIFNIIDTIITYNLNVSVPDTLGSLQNITINLENRNDYVFKAVDFTSKYTDVDGDIITDVFLYGTGTEHIRLNGVTYVEGSAIKLSDINLGKLIFVAPNQDTISSVVLTYKIKDNKNNIIE